MYTSYLQISKQNSLKNSILLSLSSNFDLIYDKNIEWEEISFCSFVR